MSDSETTDLRVTGNFVCAIDAKGRVVLPTAVREAIDEKKYGSGFCIVPGRIAGSFAMFADAYFERTRPPQRPGMTASDATYRKQVFSNALESWIKPDAQHRFLLPEWIVRRCQLTDKVMICGSGDHLTLWRPEVFDAFIDEMYRDMERSRHSPEREVAPVGYAPVVPQAPVVALTVSRSE